MVTKTHRGIKTSLEIPEELWRATKIRVIDEGSDLRAVIIAALELYLKTKPKKEATRAR